MEQSPKRSNGPRQSWLASRPPRAELSRYIDLIRSHWIVLVAFVAVGLVAAFVYVSLAPKTYTAEADLLVTPVAADDPNLIGLPLVRSTADPTADVLTVSKLVSSPSVASLVARQLGGNPDALLAHITATPVTQSEIIAVQATDSKPARAAKLANAFAEQTVQARTNAMHAQLATLIPSLEASMRGLTPGEGAGLASQLAVLATLRVSPDPTLRVSSTAATPTSPASPTGKLSLAAGGFAGLIIGLLAVLALAALDPKLRDEDQLREIYDLPLLARIPRQRAGASPLTPRELVAPVSEAFRTLRSGFTVRNSKSDEGRTVLITGDAAGDGKTTVALNLATSLVAAGKQVIVIESDLRRPSIGRALRVSAPRGLAEVLLGKAELVDALVWLRPYGPQLELLLATTADADDLDRIAPERARELVREARAICDYVVIDAPPLTDVTDAVPFAEQADDVLLVARVGNSHVRKMIDLGELLTRQGIVPTGVVVIGSAESGGEYNYYNRSGGQPVLRGLLRRHGLPAKHEGELELAQPVVMHNGRSATSDHVRSPGNGDG
jgi:capsular exopolysaccharide synthesis family protein